MQYLNKHDHSGKAAADEIFAKVQEHMGSLRVAPDTSEIVVRVFTNLKDLRLACFRHGHMNADANINAFAQGFSRRRPLFDFVDVGSGKEEAVHKIQDLF